MSRSTDNEPKPEGLLLPFITPETFLQTVKVIDEKRKNPGSFFEEELPRIERENSELERWIIKVSNLEAVTPSSRPSILNTVMVCGVTYRLLHKQAEAEAMERGEFTAIDAPLLPEVLPDAVVVLPLSKIRSPEFLSQMRALVLQGDENPHLLKIIQESAEGDLAEPVLLGMYWLLKYHSKPREKK